MRGFLTRRFSQVESAPVATQKSRELGEAVLGDFLEQEDVGARAVELDLRFRSERIVA